MTTPQKKKIAFILTLALVWMGIMAIGILSKENDEKEIAACMAECREYFHLPMCKRLCR